MSLKGSRVGSRTRCARGGRSCRRTGRCQLVSEEQQSWRAPARLRAVRDIRNELTHCDQHDPTPGFGVSRDEVGRCAQVALQPRRRRLLVEEVGHGCRHDGRVRWRATNDAVLIDARTSSGGRARALGCGLSALGGVSESSPSCADSADGHVTPRDRRVRPRALLRSPHSLLRPPVLSEAIHEPARPIRVMTDARPSRRTSILANGAEPARKADGGPLLQNTIDGPSDTVVLKFGGTAVGKHPQSIANIIPCVVLTLQGRDRRCRLLLAALCEDRRAEICRSS